MNTFQWDDCYLTGEDEVDRQHHRLVELINAFADVVAGERTGSAVEVAQALAALAEYADLHFADEERIAELGGVHSLTREAHRALHSAFIEQIRRMVAASVSHRDLLDFLVYWLAHHILEADRSLMRELHAIQAGLGAEEARELERMRASVDRDPLLHALSGLFQALSRRNAELGEANARLEQRVAERTEALARANERLELAASTDFLTGLPNRRQAVGRLEELCANSGPVGVIMLDADGFKG